MNLNAIAPADSGSKNSARGVPFRFGSLCRRSLATLVPTKVVGLGNQDEWSLLWPTDLWGDCGYWRSDHGDGDENSSRELSLPIGRNKQIDLSRGHKLK
jgi:hypothetical protein